MCNSDILEEMSNLDKIAITCGDPAGVGLEIIQSWWNNAPNYERESVVIIGPEKWLNEFKGVGACQCIAVGSSSFDYKPGMPTEEGARIAFEALEIARNGCFNNDFCGVVTGPISKEWMNRVGFDYPGQTEYFAAPSECKPVMGFVAERMVVTLATWHIPLAEVPHHINKETLSRTIRETDQLLKLLGKGQSIGVCGLNPHAGENGLYGFEEKQWIDQFLKKEQERFPGLFHKTIPADTIFYRHLRGEFDAVIALYHDQGLGPMKTVEFETAVNVTLGLPFIRTSPDHGTAFDIAGKKLANSKSMNNAVALALKLSKKKFEDKICVKNENDKSRI